MNPYIYAIVSASLFFGDAGSPSNRFPTGRSSGLVFLGVWASRSG